MRRRKVSCTSVETSSSTSVETSPLTGPLPKPKAEVSTLGPYLPISSQLDAIFLSIFILLAVATRFYRIDLPPAVVFDELHFSKFVDRVLTQTCMDISTKDGIPTDLYPLLNLLTMYGIFLRAAGFFDIHPPLGKLILAYGSQLLGYRPDPSFVIEKIGDEYPAHMKYTIVRCVSATFSVATVPLTYLIARKLEVSRVSSAVATTSVLLDFLGVIEGRLILMDSQLMFFCQLSLYFALHLWQTRKHSAERVVWLFATGLAAGAALSIKHTALATPGLIAIVSFFGLQYLAEPLELMECAYAGFCGICVYVVSFFVMFNALWHTGGKYDNFMPSHFRRTLIGSKNYNPHASRVPFYRLFVYLNRRMVQSNAGIQKRHTWESDWYQWIVNWRGVLYYLKREAKGGESLKTQIYLLGNPVVIYMTLLSVIIFVALILLSVRYRHVLSNRLRSPRLQWMRGNGVFLLAGWLCNLLPYILVDRAAFIYHYMPGLFYGQLLSAVLLDILPTRARSAVAVLAIGSIAAAFSYWSPWIYGLPLNNAQHYARQWLPKWN